MFKTLILIDNDFITYSLDLTAVANRLAGNESSIIYGLGINLSNKEVVGLDHLICIDIETGQIKDSRILTDIVEQVYSEYHFDSIIILATDYGRMVAPRLAMRLNVGLVADITDIIVDEQGRKLVRPAFSGNMLASIVCESSPIMASVHPNVFQGERSEKKTEIIHFPIQKMKTSSIEILSVSKPNNTQDIREAKVIVSAGGGFKASIDKLTGLASKLEGSIAVSKRLVDENRASRAIQVGQSGKTVSPDLYIAIGIYGAIHHIEGLKNVKNIISVNTDRNAPINHLSDMIVIGDALEFVEKINSRLKTEL